MNLKDLKMRMEELGTSPNKTLGQNFLVNNGIIQKIVTSAFSDSAIIRKKVIEVGPGLGSLTELLLERCNGLSLKLELLEFDRKLANYWQDRGVNVVVGDALKLDWQSLKNPKDSLLVSNLPYQISSGVVIERSVDPANISKMVLMFQKEVAQRIVSEEGSKVYGILSVIAQTFWDVELVVEVGAGSFYPPPKVTSRVLSFVRKKNIPISSVTRARSFCQLVKASFAFRRKQLRKNLDLYLSSAMKEHKISADVLLSKLSLATTVRAEDVSVEQYLQMFMLLEEKRNKQVEEKNSGN